VLLTADCSDIVGVLSQNKLLAHKIHLVYVDLGLEFFFFSKYLSEKQK
jgi:hypothetical protein